MNPSPSRQRLPWAASVRHTQSTLTGIIFFALSWFAVALTGFWQGLLITALVIVGLRVAVEALTRRVERRSQTGADPARPHPATTPEGATIVALLALEIALLMVLFMAQFAPYSALDLLSRTLGNQGALTLEQSATSLFYTADSRQLLVADYKGRLTLWTPSAPSGVRRIEIGDRYILQARPSPDGQMIAVRLDNGSLQLRRSADGALLHTFPDVGTEACFSADSTLLATVGEIRPAQVWRVADGQLLQTSPHEHGASFAGFAPDNTLITRTIPLPTNDYTPAEFSPGGRVGAIGGQDGGIRLIDSASGQTLRTIQAHHNRVWLLSFSADGTLLASSGGVLDRTVRIWRVADGRQVALYLPKTSPDSLAFAPDRRTLAVAENRSVSLWRVPAQP